jgi:hypothetical protein
LRSEISGLVSNPRIDNGAELHLHHLESLKGLVFPMVKGKRKAHNADFILIAAGDTPPFFDSSEPFSPPSRQRIQPFYTTCREAAPRSRQSRVSDPFIYISTGTIILFYGIMGQEKMF